MKSINFLFGFSDPTYKDDMIVGFHAIQDDNMVLLDISNDGLKLMPNPRKDANELWARIEERAKTMIKNQKISI